MESFHSRVRDELLDVEELSCVAEARIVIADWREDYNLRRPHSALALKAPAIFAAEWATRQRTPAPAFAARGFPLRRGGVARAAAISFDSSRFCYRARDGTGSAWLCLASSPMLAALMRASAQPRKDS